MAAGHIYSHRTTKEAKVQRKLEAHLIDCAAISAVLGRPAADLAELLQ